MKDDTAEITAIERQRCQAELDGDMAVLERLLDDGLVYVHASGTIDSKKNLIASRANTKFLEMTRRDLKVEVSGDLAIIAGGMFVKAKVAGMAEPYAADMFVTQALVRRGGQWRFILQQGTTFKK